MRATRASRNCWKCCKTRAWVSFVFANHLCKGFFSVSVYRLDILYTYLCWCLRIYANVLRVICETIRLHLFFFSNNNNNSVCNAHPPAGKEEERQMFQQMQAMAQKQVFPSVQYEAVNCWLIFLFYLNCVKLAKTQTKLYF